MVLGVAYVVIRLAYRRNETTKFGAPFVPLEPKVVNRVMEMAAIIPGEIFYDLGSGDGRLVIAAALLGARAYGVEIDPFRVWYSRLWIKLLGLSQRAAIIHKNFFEVDLSKADVVTMYLLQTTNDQLLAKLKQEIKKGARLVGIAFHLKGWRPVMVDPQGPIYGPLYLYKKT